MTLERKYRYRRRLPHIQADAPLVIDFVTCRRWILPERARDVVFECCLYENGRKADLIAAVVMPDHVHLLLKPARNADGWHYSLPEIMGSLKSAAAHKINRALSRKGPVWQEEFFDHALRASEPLSGAVEYIRNNPVKAGLVSRPKDYRWLFVADGY